MNRTKKITLKHKKKLKKANAKLSSTNKPKYISKAERERLATMETTEANSVSPLVSQPESSSETWEVSIFEFYSTSVVIWLLHLQLA